METVDCACAHSRITWQTEPMDQGVRGWWACTDCETVFVPMKVYEAEIGCLKDALHSLFCAVCMNFPDWIRKDVELAIKVRKALGIQPGAT